MSEELKYYTPLSHSLYYFLYLFLVILWRHDHGRVFWVGPGQDLFPVVVSACLKVGNLLLVDHLHDLAAVLFAQLHHFGAFLPVHLVQIHLEERLKVKGSKWLRG